jgi:hypothetical protein
VFWTTILTTILGLAAIVAVALAYGSRRWRGATKAMHARLEEARLPVGPARYDAKALNGLPAPVQRYFRAVLTDGQPMVLAGSVEQRGSFNMSVTGDQWKPFTAVQRIITRRPGFDWEARIRMAPCLAVKVHDAYIAGEGMLHASLFGLVSLARLRGVPEAAQGELMRFLGEAAWYPTALLPSQGVQWEAVDDASAKATLKDGETVVTLLVRFDENGLIESVRAEARPRMVAEAIIPTPWEGRWRHYAIREGMRIPLEGEVAWVLPEGPKPYWRGRITKLSYEFSP